MKYFNFPIATKLYISKLYKFSTIKLFKHTSVLHFIIVLVSSYTHIIECVSVCMYFKSQLSIC